MEHIAAGWRAHGTKQGYENAELIMHATEGVLRPSAGRMAPRGQRVEPGQNGSPNRQSGIPAAREPRGPHWTESNKAAGSGEAVPLPGFRDTAS
jgi:hypothetical protein